jgi:hypothetical protein
MAGNIEINKGLVIACQHVLEGSRQPEFQEDGVIVCSVCRNVLKKYGFKESSKLLSTVHPHHVPILANKRVMMKIIDMGEPYG